MKELIVQKCVDPIIDQGDWLQKMPLWKTNHDREVNVKLPESAVGHGHDIDYAVANDQFVYSRLLLLPDDDHRPDVDDKGDQADRDVCHQIECVLWLVHVFGLGFIQY